MLSNQATKVTVSGFNVTIMNNELIHYGGPKGRRKTVGAFKRLFLPGTGESEVKEPVLLQSDTERR